MQAARPDDLVEIDHGVESAAMANPVVDGVADGSLRRVPPRVVGGGRDVVPRDDRDADRLHSGGLEAPDDLLQARHHLRGGGASPDVVGPLEDDHVRGAAPLEDVAIEPLQVGHR